mgnify:CR=1 FL=1
MTPKEQNDYFYVCSLIEYIARKTKNKRGTIVNLLGKKGIEKQLYDAEVNHCLSFDQVSDELIEFYNIPEGDFDTISTCKYTVPNFMDIGKLYSIMIEDCAEEGKEVDELIRIFSSFIPGILHWIFYLCFRYDRRRHFYFTLQSFLGLLL